MSRRSRTPELELKRRLRIARTNNAFGRIRNERGARNEMLAHEICAALQGQGDIHTFWAAPRYSVLDRMGIDIVCRVRDSYYLLNVKSSLAGADNPKRRKTQLADWSAGDESPLSEGECVIYPWIVRGRDEKGMAEDSLRSILRSGRPSCVVLPSHVEEALQVLSANHPLTITELGMGTESTSGKREKILLRDFARAKEQKILAQERKRAKASLRSILYDSTLSPVRKVEALDEEGLCRILCKDSRRVEIPELLFGEATVRRMWLAEVTVEFHGVVLHEEATERKKDRAEKRACGEIIERIIRSPESADEDTRASVLLCGVS